MLLFVRSFVPACIITTSGFFRISDFKWSHISSVVAPGWFLTLTLKDSLDKPCWWIRSKSNHQLLLPLFCIQYFYIFDYGLNFLVLLFYHKSLCFDFFYLFWFYFFTGVMKLWKNSWISILRSVVCLTIWYIRVSPTISSFYCFRWYSVIIYCFFSGTSVFVVFVCKQR